MDWDIAQSSHGPYRIIQRDEAFFCIGSLQLGIGMDNMPEISTTKFVGGISTSILSEMLWNEITGWKEEGELSSRLYLEDELF